MSPSLSEISEGSHIPSSAYSCGCIQMDNETPAAAAMMDFSLSILSFIFSETVKFGYLCHFSKTSLSPVSLPFAVRNVLFTGDFRGPV